PRLASSSSVGASGKFWLRAISLSQVVVRFRRCSRRSGVRDLSRTHARYRATPTLPPVSARTVGRGRVLKPAVPAGEGPLPAVDCVVDRLHNTKLCRSLIDRSDLSRARALALAYEQFGDDRQAEPWAARLVELVQCVGMLQAEH